MYIVVTMSIKRVDYAEENQQASMNESELCEAYFFWLDHCSP